MAISFLSIQLPNDNHLKIHLQTTTGVACATLPTSSSACMIFLIRATGNLQTVDLRTIFDSEKRVYRFE